MTISDFSAEMAVYLAFIALVIFFQVLNFPSFGGESHTPHTPWNTQNFDGYLHGFSLGRYLLELL